MSGIVNRIKYHISFNRMYALYEIIDKSQGLTIVEMSKVLKKSEKRMRFYVNSLFNDGLIKKIINKDNNSEEIIYQAKHWKELINWDEIRYIERSECSKRFR